ncbi:MAG: hypothetical protein JST16_12250 [Bdellovibrionales bacterium]|nr:hypothetical protein [Bdellovibrionales bacterium]
MAPKSFMTAKDFVKVEMATDLKSTNTTPPNVTLTKEGIKKLQTATGKLAKTSGWIAIMDKDLPVTFIPVQAEIATPYIVLGRVAMEQVCVKTH